MQPDELSGQEHRRSNVPGPEAIQDLPGDVGVGPPVEGEGDLAHRQVTADDVVSRQARRTVRPGRRRPSRCRRRVLRFCGSDKG
jgi:hypothetical protein